MAEIKTIEELEKNIGKILVFQVINNWQPYTWMEKLKSIGEPRETIWKLNKTNEVDCLPCKGLFVVQIYPEVRPYSGLYGGNIYDQYQTNAQNIIRTPTKEELNIFRNYWRKRVILGHK